MRNRAMLATTFLAVCPIGIAISAPAPAPSDAWQSSVRRSIERAEYEITWQSKTTFPDLPSAWQAPNRAQGLRTFFTGSGIRVQPRTRQDASWEWRLKLVAAGRPGAPAPVAEASAQARADRIEYDRGAILERYDNDERGLGIGFTLTSAPARRGTGLDPSRVWIELSLGGSLLPRVAADGQAIDFAMPGGMSAIHLGRLQVKDAAGRLLPARMEGTGSGIRLSFSDEGAVYPVTVASLATASAWTADGGQVSAQLGYSLASAGDVNGDGFADVVVAATFYDNGGADEGRVLVFDGSAAGLAATPSATIDGSQEGAWMGYSVAPAGDVDGDGYADILVGAVFEDGAAVDEGRAFLYRGSAAGLQATPSWTASGSEEYSQFGFSVATAGDVNGDGYSDVIVSALVSEKAYVYYGSAAGLAAAPSWIAGSDQVGASFGGSVATAGDVNGDGYADVLVSAFTYDDGEWDEGRVFLYYGSAAGLAATPSWSAESNQQSAWFGYQVASAGDVNGDGYADVIVGSYLEDRGETDEGVVVVYQGSATGLAASPSWTMQGNQASENFGSSVASAGDVNGDGYADVIVGAIHYDHGETDEGGAFVYFGSASGLSTVPAWSVESQQAGAEMGYAVGTAGDVNGDGYADIIVGAWGYDGAETDEGRAFVFHGSPSGLSPASSWTAESDQMGGQLGYSLAGAGDVNGDGFADAIVAATFYDGGAEDEGRVFAYYGSAAGLQTTPAWSAEDGQEGEWFGYSVASAGDVNGDGFADVLVGAVFYDHEEMNEGGAFLYYGSAAGLSATPGWTAEGNQAYGEFGFVVATAGDVNGDGYADVIVGAQSYDGGETDEGRALVYYGSAAGLSTTPSWTAEGDQASAAFGCSVATAGDVNRDGYSDVIVGACFYDDGAWDEGRAVVYHGSATGLATTPAWTAESDQQGAWFGYQVASAGDVNGDGYADVIVSAILYDGGEPDEGRAFLYEGSPAGLATTPAWTAEGDQPSAEFGSSVASAGDVNGDGYADVIVGAIHYDHGQEDEGAAFVYYGSAAGPATAPSWTAESDQASAELGYSVATAGDVNGDGYSDVIVGAWGFDGGEMNEGRAFLYYGNGGLGLAVRPQQLRVDSTGTIPRLGMSDREDAFRLGLLGRSPSGRGRVKLEWEVKPLGSLFDGTDTGTASAWTDTGTGGAPLLETVADLTGLTPYHWRVRMLYDPVTSPFMQGSRWITVPWGGWQETMLRTAGPSTAAAGRAGTLRLTKAGGDLSLAWGASCVGTDSDYAIYEGTIGTFTSHASRACSTGGATSTTLTPLPGSTYYLVVPLGATREGSYGKTSAGERPAGTNACLPQQIAVCN